MSADTVPHGEYSGYKWHGCRCTPCRKALRDYQNTATRLKAYGQWDRYGDTAKVRAHIRVLQALDWKIVEIARAAGVATSVVWAIDTNPERGVYADTARRVLGVDPASPRPDPARYPAHGATNRVRCLAALGWSPSAVAREAGLSADLTTKLARGVRSEVSAYTMRRICEVYERLSPVRPEGRVADRVRRESAAKLWGPPAAWDDEWLDMSPAELDEEMGRLVGLMGAGERKRWWRAVHEGGELSPLAVAAAGVPRGRRVVERKVAA